MPSSTTVSSVGVSSSSASPGLPEAVVSTARIWAVARRPRPVASQSRVTLPAVAMARDLSSDGIRPSLMYARRTDSARPHRLAKDATDPGLMSTFKRAASAPDSTAGIDSRSLPCSDAVPSDGGSPSIVVLLMSLLSKPVLLRPGSQRAGPGTVEARAAGCSCPAFLFTNYALASAPIIAVRNDRSRPVLDSWLYISAAVVSGRSTRSSSWNPLGDLTAPLQPASAVMSARNSRHLPRCER